MGRRKRGGTSSELDLSCSQGSGSSSLENLLPCADGTGGYEAAHRAGGPASSRSKTDAKVCSFVGAGLALTADELGAFLLKVGERLYFEKTILKGYDALISKCELFSADLLPAELDIIDLVEIRSQKHRFVKLLASTLEGLGGEGLSERPPSGSLLLAITGVCRAIEDVTAGIEQSLECLLIAELADDEGWDLLICDCDDLGLAGLSASLDSVQEISESHTEMVREWIHLCREERRMNRAFENETGA